MPRTQLEAPKSDLVGYQRFSIERRPAANAYPVPSKFDVKARKFRLAAMLLHEAFQYRFNRKVVLSRPCIYGVFSGTLGGFRPINEKCVGCMRCVQEYPHIMTVRHSDAYQKLGDSHWTPDDVFSVLYEASTGRIPVKGMGYKGAFAGEGFDDMWTDMSEIVRPTRDGVYGREYISTVVDIGRKPRFLDFSRNDPISNVNSIEIPIPVIFDDLPIRCLNDETMASVASAASLLGTFYFHMQSDKPPPHQESWIPIASADKWPAHLPASRKTRVIEYQDGQADPEELRKIGSDRILSVRLPLKQGCEDRAAILVENGIDVLHVYADLHGMDYSNTPRHLSEALKALHNRLVREGVRDSVTIIASGGITLAEHVPKAIICGADLVGVDTALLVALQAAFKGQAKDRDNCGLLPRKIAPAWGTQRIVNLMASWHDQLIEVLSAMGMRDVRRLRGDIGRSMLNSELREQALEGTPWAT